MTMPLKAILVKLPLLLNASLNHLKTSPKNRVKGGNIMKTVKVKDLTKGDRVKLENGKIVTIAKIDNGMIGNNSKLLHYSNWEFGNMHGNEQVQVFINPHQR